MAAEELEASRCQKRLKVAERFIRSLAAEQARWGEIVDAKRAARKTIAGDAILSASFLAYAGPMGSGMRGTLWRQHWLPDLASREVQQQVQLFLNVGSLKHMWLVLQVALSEDVDPVELLSTVTERAEWANEGLPADRGATENGVLVLGSRRWPLLVDPQGMGARWVRGHEEARSLEHTRSKGLPPPPPPPSWEMEPATGNDQLDSESVGVGVGVNEEEKALFRVVCLSVTTPDWFSELIQCIEGGHVCILEGIGEDIDPSVMPLLAKSAYRKGRHLFLRLRGEEVEFDPRFRLYLATRLATPRFGPDLCSHCTLVDFTVSQACLEEQLLSTLMTLEQPELEAESAALSARRQGFVVELQQLEDAVLERLALAVTDDVLGDVPLIESLERSRDAVDGINVAQEKSGTAAAAIKRARDGLRVVAKEAADLYFTVQGHAFLDHSYRSSIDRFLVVFERGVAKADEAEDPRKRVSLLRLSVRRALFLATMRGLQDRHRLLFLVQATLGFLRADSFHHDTIYRFKKAQSLVFSLNFASVLHKVVGGAYFLLPPFFPTHRRIMPVVVRTKSLRKRRRTMLIRTQMALRVSTSLCHLLQRNLERMSASTKRPSGFC